MAHFMHSADEIKRLFLSSRNDEELQQLYADTVVCHVMNINGVWYTNKDFAEEIDHRVRLSDREEPK